MLQTSTNAFSSTYGILKEIMKHRKVADSFVSSQFDPKFSSEGDQFVLFDFHNPKELPSNLVGTFDFVVVDPPFITREVWELYAQAVKLLLRSKDSKILLTTIGRAYYSCRARTFKPSIPHLVYQYALYTNYESPALDVVNPEVDFD
ncbi:unnamed protein product [Phytophthora lilii]|uniref:Unnamed protein product n=1 Tax=Phytophthora lilii TaxID=2077276 RepID=A0A9W6TYM3_9STRA|nr:unnamed protein product [Phytophthora lilii]